MFLYFNVSSKDNKILKKFLQFLLKLNISPVVIKYVPKQQKRKFVTILKSPHINKTAQEQFEFRHYSKKFIVNSVKPLTFFLIIKKLKNLSFSGLKLEVKGLLNFERKNKSFLNQLDPDNIILNQHRTYTKRYIQLFDCYGEIWLKTLLSVRKNS
uniref:Ribosomal protein S10 n=1 Tax=Durinskia baltica diatom endosymbiont TaxID=1079368 RepID=I6N5P9_9STRA|nr:ribosomal protein S10 [Durinskia baltica diatom endosymbiont]